MRRLCDFSSKTIGRPQQRYTGGGYRYKAYKSRRGRWGYTEDRIVRDYSAMLHRLPSAYEAEYAVQCPAQAAPFFSSRSNKTIRMPAKDPNDRSTREAVVLYLKRKILCLKLRIVVVARSTISLSNTCLSPSGWVLAWADVWDLGLTLLLSYPPSRPALGLCTAITGQPSTPTPLYYCAFPLLLSLSPSMFPASPGTRHSTFLTKGMAPFRNRGLGVLVKEGDGCKKRLEEEGDR